MQPSSSATSQPGPASLQPAPKRLADRYQLVRVLGQGGMGTVYLAQDPGRGQVALKLLDPALMGGLGLVRFKREFRAAARLRHPFCVPVYDLGQDGDRRFFTMEYLAGGSLERRGPLLPERVAVIALEVLAALDHIHGKDIIHRDIKPQNILLTDEDGSVKLSDFGIAKVSDIDESGGHGVIGSLAYMPPEQADGRADPRSDLYSLGVVLYQLLCGQLPFSPPDGAPAQRWLELHEHAAPRPLYDTPEGLAQVVLRLLAKDPAERYATAALAYAAVRHWLGAAFEVPAHPPLLARPYLSAPRFTGRQEEVRRGDAFVEQIVAPVGDSRPGALLLSISGEAGLGKSRLALRLLRHAQSRGVLVLTATCRAEPGVPFEPLTPLLQLLHEREDGLAAPRVDDGADSDNGDGATLVDGATPLPAPEAGGEGGFDQREGQRLHFQRQVAEQVVALGQRRPLLFLLEDCHWADAPSLMLLSFVLRGLLRARESGQPAQVGLIITYRPTSDHSALSNMLSTAAEWGTRVALDLLPLPLADAAALVGSMLAAPVDDALLRLSARLVGQAGGNPLYLGQILHLLVISERLRPGLAGWRYDEVILGDAALPETLREAVGDRAARLSTQTKSLLAGAAVLGRRFQPAALAALLGLDEPLFLDCLDEAMRAGFLEEDTDAYRFTHDRFREAIYERLPLADAQAFHRLAADYIERTAAAAPDVAADIAHHLVACGERARALPYTERAADFAMRSSAFARAADLYEQALDLSRTTGAEVGALIDRCGDACLQAGRYEQATSHIEVQLAATLEPLRRAELLRKAADIEFRQGQVGRAVVLLEDVLRTVGFTPPSSQTLLWLGLLRSTAQLLLYAVAPGAVPRAAVAAEVTRLRVIVRACNILTEGYYANDYSRASFYMVTSLNVAVRIGPGPELAVALSQLGYILTTFGLYRIGERYLRQADQVAEDAAGPLERSWTTVLHGLACGTRGEVAENDELSRRAAVHLTNSREPQRIRQVWAIHAEALLMRGRLAAGEEIALQLRQLGEDLNDSRSQGWALLILGHAAARRGDSERGIALLREAAQASARASDLNYKLVSQARLGLELALVGQLDEALAISRGAAVEVARLNLRHATCVADGAFLVAAALVRRRDGRVSGDSLRQVLRVRLLRRSFAHALRYTTPLYVAGQGAWLLAQGAARRGHAAVDRGLTLAEERQLGGEQLDIHRLLAVLLPPGAERDRHLAAVTSLRAQGEEGR